MPPELTDAGAAALLRVLLAAAGRTNLNRQLDPLIPLPRQVSSLSDPSGRVARSSSASEVA